MKIFLKIILSIWIASIGVSYYIFDPFNIFNSRPVIDIIRYLVFLPLPFLAIYFLYKDKIGINKYTSIIVIFFISTFSSFMRSYITGKYGGDEIDIYKYIVRGIWTLIVVIIAGIRLFKNNFTFQKLNVFLKISVSLYFASGLLSLI